MNISRNDFIALLGGFLVAIAVGFSYQYFKTTIDSYDGYYEPFETEYHIHADFAVYFNDTRMQLTDERFMSSAEHSIHPDLHLHDSNQDLLHVHKKGLTLANFFNSLGMPLRNDCITDERGFEHCTGSGQELALFVNGERINDIVSYIPNDGDRILLYYGKKDNPNITTHTKAITDQACIYSGTCPERGTPPPEACDLTRKI